MVEVVICNMKIYSVVLKMWMLCSENVEKLIVISWWYMINFSHVRMGYVYLTLIKCTYTYICIIIWFAFTRDKRILLWLLMTLSLCFPACLDSVWNMKFRVRPDSDMNFQHDWTLLGSLNSSVIVITNYSWSYQSHSRQRKWLSTCIII